MHLMAGRAIHIGVIVIRTGIMRTGAMRTRVIGIIVHAKAHAESTVASSKSRRT